MSQVGGIPNGASAAANAPGIAQPIPGSQGSAANSDNGSDRDSGAASVVGSAIGSAAPDPPGTAQPTMQQLMAMMVQQNQALLNMQQMHMTPQSPGINMQSHLSRAVDLRGMLKCEELSGGKETFPDWKRTLYSTIDLVNPQWAAKAKQIERSLDTEVKLSSMTPEAQAEA